jgi:hypothetical protein
MWGARQSSILRNSHAGLAAAREGFEVCRNLFRSIGVGCGLRDRGWKQRAVLQILNAFSKNMLEFGEGLLVGPGRFLQLQLAENIAERGDELLGL